MEYYREVMDGIGRAIDSIGVLVIVAGAISPPVASLLNDMIRPANRIDFTGKTWDELSYWVLSFSSQAT